LTVLAIMALWLLITIDGFGYHGPLVYL
jgi:hypothetical protein